MNPLQMSLKILLNLLYEKILKICKIMYIAYKYIYYRI